ncbi:SatD family protein [Lutibacter citreus]|uniref:SatD family protein n=1 Tax=Lutibacter citreus TaxID=2138210 RepID=UPI000DBE21C0|nr:SatD family protein [Lutibacter citreus]
MIGIITGDIINSRAIEPKEWMPKLKSILSVFGLEPEKWEIYRGDSFQLEVASENSLKAAILIKATIKLVKGLDVRLAIGIGEKSYSTQKITESNGSAFVNSGECFDNLKKSHLAIKTANEDFNTEMNLFFDLAQLTINNWSQKSAEVVKTAIEHPNKTQKELSVLLNKSQSTINKGLKIAGYDEIMRMEKFYRNQISKLW